ncbi:MAG: TolC family protein [Flavobacteriales bacterium]|nr:TolC family protein [Flavobacteriales bacterium]
MKIIKIITSIALTIGIGTSVFGQNYSLEEAKAYAIENNLSAKQAENAIEIARLKMVETRGMGLPQVEFNGSFNHFINLPVNVLDAKFFNPLAADGETISFQAGTKFNSTGSLQVNQIIFNGSYIVALQTADLFRSFQETSSNQIMEDIIFNVIQAYEMASISKENLIFLDSLVSSTQSLIDKQKNFLDLGLILQEDMDQLNYSLLNSKSVYATAEINYQNAIAMLQLVMGYPMNETITITDSPEQLMQKKSLSNGNLDIHSNIGYSILEKQVELFKMNVKNNKFANLPSLNGYFQQSYNAYRNEFNFFANEKWYPQTVWGLQLKIPIFSGLTRYAKTAQAKVDLMDSENQLTQAEQNLQFQEIQYRNNLKGAQNKFELQTENVGLASSIYDNALTKEKIGSGNSIDVTQKHTQLLMAQANYVGSMVELFQSQLSLDKLYNNILPKNK